MIRKSMVSSICAAIALVASAPFAFGQQAAVLKKPNPFMTPTKNPSTAEGAALGAALNKANSAVQANANKKNGAQLQTFTYTVTSSRDGNVTGEIVGRSPFFDSNGRTSVSTQLYPIVT